VRNQGIVNHSSRNGNREPGHTLSELYSRRVHNLLVRWTQHAAHGRSETSRPSAATNDSDVPVIMFSASDERGRMHAAADLGQRLYGEALHIDAFIGALSGLPRFATTLVQ